MSLLLDDKSLHSLTNLAGGRGSRRAMSKTSLGLNADSPRTQEACRELGILPQELSSKAPESFAEGAPNQDIAQLRYNHYIVRYNQLLRDVTLKRRELIKRRRNVQIQEGQSPLSPQAHQHAAPQPHEQNALNSAKSPRSYTSLNNSGTLSHSNIRATTALTNTIPVSPGLLANYTKTVSYLRRSHDSPHIKNPKELHIAMEEESKPFDMKLVNEIDKFNTTKRMKQKEAIKAYEDDLKRIKMIVDIEERTKRKEDLEEALRQQKMKKKKEIKLAQEEKLQAIREREHDEDKLRSQGEARINKKSAEKQKKVEHEREQKLRVIQESDQRQREKKRKADEVRERHNWEVEQHIEEMRQRLEDKMAESQEKLENTLNHKIEKIQDHIQKLNEKVAIIKEDRVVQEKEFIHGLVDKIKEKESRNLVFEKQREVMYKEKVAKIKIRNQQFAENALSVRLTERQKVSNLIQKQSEADKRIAAQKADEDYEFKKRQEVRRLKMADTLENFDRKKRIIEYEQEKVLEKERKTAEKLRYLNSQKEVIQNARLESALQAKIERDRISEAVMNLRKVIRPRDKKERIADELEEKAREEALAQQAQQQLQQAGSNPEQKKKPVSLVTKELKKIHEKGFKLLANFVQFDQKDLEEFDHLIEVKTEVDDAAPETEGAGGKAGAAKRKAQTSHTARR